MSTTHTITATTVTLLLICGSVSAQEKPPISLGTDYLGNLFYIGQPVVLRLSVSGKVKAAVRWEVRDLDDKVVARGEVPPVDGQKIRPRVRNIGIYYMTCQSGSGSEAVLAATRFTIVHRLPLTGREKSPFGINGGGLFHFAISEVPMRNKRNLIQPNGWVFLGDETTTIGTRWSWKRKSSTGPGLTLSPRCSSVTGLTYW